MTDYVIGLCTIWRAVSLGKPDKMETGLLGPHFVKRLSRSMLRDQEQYKYATPSLVHTESDVDDKGEYLCCCGGYGNIACDYLCSIVHSNK